MKEVQSAQRSLDQVKMKFNIEYNKINKKIKDCQLTTNSMNQEFTLFENLITKNSSLINDSNENAKIITEQRNNMIEQNNILTDKFKDRQILKFELMNNTVEMQIYLNK